MRSSACLSVLFGSCLIIFLVISGRLHGQGLPGGESWQRIKQAGKGTITIHWYESRPFIYSTPNGLRGIEYEIMKGFQKFVKNAYHVDLTLNWKAGKDFED